MSEDQLAILGFICLFLIVLSLYFSVEISEWFKKLKKQQTISRANLTTKQIEESERTGWRAIFKHNVLAPLAIGHIIGGLGLIFENNTLAWIGVAFIIYGYYLMIRD